MLFQGVAVALNTVIHTTGVTSGPVAPGPYPGVYCAVYLTGTQTLAAIRENPVVVAPNPFLVNADGRYAFEAPNPDYDLIFSTRVPVTASTLAAATAAVGLVIDGGGSVITTGVKGFVEVPFACRITAVTLLSTDAAVTPGSIVIDIWKDTFANYAPTVADRITGSAKPTLASATKSRDTTLTGWTTALAAGDILGFAVDSVTALLRVSLSLTVQAT